MKKLYKNLKTLQIFLFFILVGCLSSQKQQLLSTLDNQPQASIQFSSDAKSLLSPEFSQEAKKARLELLSQDELTSKIMLSAAELSLLSANPEQALHDAREILKKDIKNKEALRLMVKIALVRNRFAEAALLADNALAVDQRNPDFISLKALALYRTGDSAGAKTLWKLALQYQPAHVSSLLNLASLYYHFGNLNAAGSAFDRVLALQKTNPDALVGKALVLCARGQNIEARDLLLAQLKSNPKHGLLLYNLALIEKERFRNYQAALEYLNSYLNAKSQNRFGVEKIIAEREEIKSLLRVEQTRLSDAELRKIAKVNTQKSDEAEQKETNLEEVDTKSLEEMIK